MHREERSVLWLEQLRQDVRYTMRQFRRSPGFAVTVIITIALGIGANTAIFTLIHSILLKSLPVADPKSLYRIGDVYTECCLTSGLDNENGDFSIFSWENYRHLRASTPEFEQLAAVQAGQGLLSVRRGGGIAQSKPSEYVSGNYFSTFGVPAFAGRIFTDTDDQAGASPVAVMSYQTWQSDYAGDPSVVGGIFYLQSQPVTVVGIAPPDFYGDRIVANPPAFWVPLAEEPLLSGANSVLHQPIASWLYLLGRLRPGVAIEPLQQKISADLRHWLLTQDEYLGHGFPAIISKVHVVLAPAGAGIQALQQQTDKKLYLLLSISALVLLVACANVANLMLARGMKRKAETSVRMALGSARSRLIRQMLTESVLLGCMGGLAGLAVAYAGTRTILALAFPDAVHSAIQATPSLAVLGFAFLLSLATGIVFGDCAGLGHVSCRSGGSLARRDPVDRGPRVAAAEIDDYPSGGVRAGAADGRGVAHKNSAEPGASGFRPAHGQPVCAASGPCGCGSSVRGATRSTASAAGVTVGGDPGNAQCRAGHVQPSRWR